MNTAVDEYRRLTARTPREPSSGADRMVDHLKGRWQQRPQVSNRLWQQSGDIDKLANSLADLPDSELQQRLQHCARIVQANGGCPAERLNESLALLVNAAYRSVAMRPYRVQIMGALVLYQGAIAEMATGEGKSLTVSLAAVLAGWSKKPCHVLTANDYLAARDEEEMRPFYAYCSVTSASVIQETSPTERKERYCADVTYTTSAELLGDYLRDRLKLGKIKQFARRLILSVYNLGSERNDACLRGLHTVFVDEADSIMIDEAVVPLIISAVRENPLLLDAVTRAGALAGQLYKDNHYRVNHKHREILFTPAGLALVDELAQALPGIWQGQRRRLELVEQALVAREFYQRDKDYVVLDGKIVLIDEFTGRLMPNRNLSLGLHQALEVAEALECTHPTESLARYNFQRFFRMFDKLGGTTGTASEARNEFWHIYQQPVIGIPKNCQCQRQALTDQVFVTKADKWQAIVDVVQSLYLRQQPVLVGTRTVEDSEQLAERLQGAGLPFELLNAVHHQREAEIIRDAGQPARITIATNMAGRGTDIKLGSGVAELGGLHVIVSELHESARIDRQLAGRCARQDDPGCVQVMCSLEDAVVKRFVPRWRRVLANAGLKRRWPGAQKRARRLFSRAQEDAQRLAQHQRHQVMKMDSWVDETLWFGKQISK